MTSKHPSHPSNEESRPEEESRRSETLGRDASVDSTQDSAFDRLLHAAAKVTSPGRMLAPGSKLCDGRFAILRRLGEGGMGVVFEARDLRQDRIVAIKTLSRVDAAGIYRMKREFRSIADVVHPYLVPLHELFADGELWFFSMELVAGERFDRYLRASDDLRSIEGDPRTTLGGKAPVDQARLRTVLAQLAAGVQAIHDAGKLHRDLKPSNVLVAESADGPRVAILDFGLASDVLSAGVTQTIERGVAGTPAYMAPEQARAEWATPASDWYAVGVMLFEALTRRLPFEGESLRMLMAKQTGAAPAVRSLNPSAPADLAELCDRLLARNPSERPTHADIHAMLGSAVSHASPGAARVPGSTRASKSGPSGDDAELADSFPKGTFVGRGRELAALELALADTNAGKPVLCLAGGPSGIGKTTFVEHFLASVKQRGDAVVLGCRCYERESVPFKGFDGIVDALTRYLARLPEVVAARLVPRHVNALVRVFPVLGRVEAISHAPQRRGLPNNDAELRLRAFDALKELLAKLAEERPLILYIDDLQWSDRDSARLLKHLLLPPDPPLLLLVATYRDDEPDAEGLSSLRQMLAEDEVKRELDVRTIELSALTPAESRRLAQQLLPPDEVERVEQIAREAGGSPFLLGELSRAVHSGQAPGDLRSAILSRLAKLSEGARAMVQALCIAPRPVTPELLARVAQQADVSAELRSLLAERLVREVAGKRDGAFQERRLGPYHDRIRETVRDAMPLPERASWHRRYAVALESMEPLDLDALAEHSLGAGERERGAEYARRAARAAVQAFAFDRAVSLFETACTHPGLSDVERAELLVELAEARVGSGRRGDAARTLLQASELDPTRLQELQRRAGEQFFINGDLAAGTDAMRRALANAGVDYDALTDPKARFPARTALLERGFRFEPTNANAIDPARLARLETLWAAALGTTWVHDGYAGLVIAYVREALEAGEPGHVARGRALLLACFEASFDPVGAGGQLADVVALLERQDTPMMRAWIAFCRGHVAFFSGSGDLGLADLQRAEELLSLPENRGMQRELSMCRTHVILAHNHHVGMGAGGEHCLRGIRLADAAGDFFGSVTLRCLGGYLLNGPLDANRARAEIRRGLELADAIGVSAHSNNNRWFGLLSLALLEMAEGNLEEALRLVDEVGGRFDRGKSTSNLLVVSGLAALLLCAVSRGVGDRASLLAKVEQYAALLARPTTWLGEPLAPPVLAGCSEFLYGQLRAAAGQLDPARTLFESAAAAARESPSAQQRHYCNARLGDLIGGERGAALRAEAEAALADQGCPPGWIAAWTVRFEA